MAATWDKYVPLTADGSPVPLAWHTLIQESIPVHRELIFTASGGTSVSLPAEFQAEIGSEDEYGVSLSKQTYRNDGGELYISDKTTTGFKVQNSGSGYGESVLVVVFWIPA